MTRIIYDSTLHTLEIDGHSGYATEGSDIVCAGISSLFCTLANALEDRFGAVHKKVYSGYALLEYTGNDDSAIILIESIVDGLKDIAEEYPENVNFSEVRKHKKS